MLKNRGHSGLGEKCGAFGENLGNYTVKNGCVILRFCALVCVVKMHKKTLFAPNSALF